MKGELWYMLRKPLKKNKWNKITQKVVSEKDQDLFDSTESVEFGGNYVTKREAMNSESDSESEEVHLNIVQESAVLTFATRKIKARNLNMAEESDDISTFTQAT